MAEEYTQQQKQDALDAVLAMESRYIQEQAAFQTLANQIQLTKTALSLVNTRSPALPRTAEYTDDVLETKLMEHREHLDHMLNELGEAFRTRSEEDQAFWRDYAIVADSIINP